MQRFRLFWLVCLICIGLWSCQSTAPLVGTEGQTIPPTTSVGEVEIPFETVALDEDGLVVVMEDEPLLLAIKSPGEISSIADRLSYESLAKLQAVDFDDFVVVALLRDFQLSTGYPVYIKRLVQRDGQLIVYAEFWSPPELSGQGMATTAPYHLVKITKKQNLPNNLALVLQKEAARQAKYGKLDSPLYERLASIAEETEVPIVIWAAHVTAEQSHEQIVAELITMYPEAAKAQEQYGIPWAMEDAELSTTIEQKYSELSRSNLVLRLEPLIEWLSARAYPVHEFPGMPALSTIVPKREITILAQNEHVAQIHLNDPQTATQ